jgi:hypothetical protein
VSVGAKRIAFPLEGPQADRAEIEVDIRGRVPTVHAHGRQPTAGRVDQRDRIAAEPGAILTGARACVGLLC